MAGWMRDQTKMMAPLPTPRLPVSPMRDGSSQGSIFWEKERGFGEDRRDERPGLIPMTHRLPPIDIPLTRPPYHTSRSFGPTHSEANYYAHSSASPIEALVSQLSALSDKVDRVYGILNTERIDNVRDKLDMVSHLLQMIAVVGGSAPQGKWLSCRTIVC
jgi:hypothetical protein